MVPFTLHGYRTSVRTSTGATPYSLVYGMEAVLPFEVEVPSQKILAESSLEELEWAQTRYDQLNLVEGKHLTAMSHGRLYQQRIKNAFDKKVCPRKFNQGDLVLKKISHAVQLNSFIRGGVLFFICFIKLFCFKSGVGLFHLSLR